MSHFLFVIKLNDAKENKEKYRRVILLTMKIIAFILKKKALQPNILI